MLTKEEEMIIYIIQMKKIVRKPDLIMRELKKPDLKIRLVRKPDLTMIKLRKPGLKIRLVRNPDLTMIELRKPALKILINYLLKMWKIVQ